MNLNSTTRFSDKVENYIKYRPHYLDEVIAYLKEKGIFKNDSVIADIGSGTGISTEIFLNNGNVVYGIEPNKEMREAAEKLFARNPNFKSINATAEETTLENNSIDLITAGQAFHWFDVEKCKVEFKRILKPDGTIVLLWNKRKRDGSPFQEEYEQLLLDYGTDYKDVGHQNIGREGLENLFNNKFELKEFANEQVFDFEGFKGRLLSSSYIPDETSPSYELMIKDLKIMFNKYNINGKISFEYVTEVFTGMI